MSAYTKLKVANLLVNKCKELRVTAHTYTLALSGLDTLMNGKFGMRGALPNIIEKYSIGINNARLLFSEEPEVAAIRNIMITGDCRVIPATIILNLWKFIQENDYRYLDEFLARLRIEVERVNIISPPPLKHTFFARAFRNKSIEKVTILQQQEINIIFQAMVYVISIVNYLPKEDGLQFILRIWRRLEPSR